jgi:hypothetical protein
LETLRGKHEDDISKLREQLEETQGEKEYADEQYQNLLGKVSTIRATIGKRLEAEAVRKVLTSVYLKVCLLTVNTGISQGDETRTGRITGERTSFENRKRWPERSTKEAFRRKSGAI